MKHLLEQEFVLDDQTNNYIKKIVKQNDILIKQNEEIKTLLKGDK